MRLDPLLVREKVKAYLMEDIGTGDITTCNLPGRERVFEAVIRPKEGGILAGLPIVKELFNVLDPSVEVKLLLKDGAPLMPGVEIAHVIGPALALLRGERTALNILQRLSGIATLTKHMVEMVSHTKARLVDTRKTTPGLRLFEKYAVHVGGGFNHRMGLYDCAMIKDNHIKVAGSIRAAMEAVRKGIPFTTKIEVESKNINEVKEAIEAGADIVMLDNMDLDTLKRAVKLAHDKVLTEASGNITPQTVRAVAETGVDYISSGFIIHHAVWLDMNMKLA